MSFIKRIVSSLILGLCLLSPTSNGSEPAPNARVRTAADLVGKDAGYATGGIMRDVLEELQGGINYLPYIDTASVVQSLRSGKIDVALLDEPSAQVWIAQYPNELYHAFTYANDYISFAINKGNPLKAKIDIIIRQLEKSGELKQFQRKWLRRADPARKITRWTHKPDYDGSAGTIHYATDPTEEPLIYLSNNELVGLDIEILNRVAYELNMRIEYTQMNFDGLIETLVSGKADMVGGCMSVTPERQEKVDFVYPYYNGGLAVIGRRGKNHANGPEFTHVSELNGKLAGIWTGTIGDTIADKYIPGAKKVQYSKLSDLVLALIDGKIDFFLMEVPQGQFIKTQQQKICFLSETPLESWDYGFIFNKKKAEICDEFSAEIRKLKADGTIEKLKQKWFSPHEEDKTMPTFKPGSKGKLRIGTVPEVEPFAYISNGAFAGLELELAGMIAEKLGYSVEFVMLDFATFAEALSAGKVDFVCACITITEERKEQFCFSESHYPGGYAVMVRNLTAQAQTDNGRIHALWEKLCASFKRTFVREQRWKLVLKGLSITIIITLAATALGTLLAFPVWQMRTAKSRVLRNIGSAYVAIMQGTPILVILMILYYVIFAKVDINGILVAVLGFGLNLAAYAGEMLRSGIDGVPKGQREAALALGFSRFQTFRKVVLPQALRQILPVYRGECIGLLKSTSIVGYIAIQDLTKMSDIIRSRTYEAFFPLIATAVIYFLTAMALAAVLNHIEGRLNPNNRRKQA